MATIGVTRRQALAGGLALLTLGGCSSMRFDFDQFGRPTGPSDSGGPGPGQSFGNGQVRVAMLLPLSGDAAAVGQSMAHGAQLAMEFIADSANINDNITLTIRDSGSGARGAASAASQAVSEGASLILGPLKADQVGAAGGVARSAGIPLIGFSNNSGAAQPGVYLLNVLPETELHRSLAYAQKQGRRAFAGLFFNTDFGRAQQSAFTQASADLGLRVVGVYNYSSVDDARSVVKQLAPTLLAGQVDTLFIPDRGTAPSLAAMLQEEGVPAGTVQVIGSGEWDRDPDIGKTAWLGGALYPAVDDAGYQALLPLYRQRFGSGTPHPFITLSYTAVILANVATLSMGAPRYDKTILTSPGGFKGRDGVFRFHADGRSDYALVMKKVAPGGAVVVDAARI